MTAANSNAGGTSSGNSRLVFTNVLEKEMATVIKSNKERLGKRYVTYRADKQPDGTYTVTFYVRE